jgi:hypothetical protein
MENRGDNNGKRRRKVVRRSAELVRSVKAGQTSTLTWERGSASLPRIWRFDQPAA